MKIQIAKLTCRKCGHSWTPRREKIFACPRCNSPRWNAGEESNGSGFSRDEIRTIQAHAQALADALDRLYSETFDYITLKRLGDPHQNQSMKDARAALEAARKDGVVK